MEAIYSLVGEGLANFNVEWIQRFAVELLGQVDVLSDFMFFGSIVSRSDVTIAAKAFVFIFGCVGLYFQVINYKLRRQASSGVKLKSGPLFEIKDSNENCFMALLSSTGLGCCFNNNVKQKSRDMNAGDKLTEDERKYCLLHVSRSSGSDGPLLLEDLPQIIILLTIEKRLSGFSALSYWTCFINIWRAVLYDSELTEELQRLRNRLDVMPKPDGYVDTEDGNAQLLQKQIRFICGNRYLEVFVLQIVFVLPLFLVGIVYATG